MLRFARSVQSLVVVWVAAILVIAAQASAGTGVWSKLRIGYGEGVSLLASQTALIMNGTFEPVVTGEWISQVMRDLVTPSLGEGYTGAAMNTPEEFWPVSGLFSLTFNNSIKVGHELLDTQLHQNLKENPGTPQAVYGHSQSAIIAAAEKRTLAAEYADGDDVPEVSFVLTGNPYRPNGGILSRLPVLAKLLTPWAQMTATPTDTSFVTHDIVRQYDLWADFPTYPLNLLADLNALFGLMNHYYLEESAPLLRNLLSTISLDPTSPNFNPNTGTQQYGDTTYHTIPSEHLPLIAPLRWIGLGPLTDIVEPTLRVLVELGYDRINSYGQVVRAGLFPKIDPGKLAADLGAAFAEGGAALRDLLTPFAPDPVTDLAATAASGSTAQLNVAPAPRVAVHATRPRSAAPSRNPAVQVRHAANAARDVRPTAARPSPKKTPALARPAAVRHNVF
jgi:hypothetical protein